MKDEKNVNNRKKKKTPTAATSAQKAQPFFLI